MLLDTQGYQLLQALERPSQDFVLRQVHLLHGLGLASTDEIQVFLDFWTFWLVVVQGQGVDWGCEAFMRPAGWLSKFLGLWHFKLVLLEDLKVGLTLLLDLSGLHGSKFGLDLCRFYSQCILDLSQIFIISIFPLSDPLLLLITRPCW